MSKRSRAERRKGQMDRAIRGGDLNAIQALVDKTPEKAAVALLAVLESASIAPDSQQLVKLALTTSEKLRKNLRFDLALQLMNALQTENPRIRFEQALAAFGNRDDAKLQEVLTDDADLAKIFEPCLAAMQGKPIPKLPTGASPLLRGLYGISRCATMVSSKRPSQFRTAATSIPKDQADVLRIAVWQNLRKVLTSHLDRDACDAARTLLSLEPFKSQRSLRASLGWELGRRHPAFVQAYDELAEIEFGPDFARSARLAAIGPISDPVARLRQFLAHGDLQTLPEEQRAAAVLYQGFFSLTSDPQQALEAFNRALAMGADLGESMRGRWLATYCPATVDWEYDHLAKNVAEQSAERLLHLLERQPDAEALRAVLLVSIGVLQNRAEDYSAFAQTAALLRNLVEQQGYEDRKLLSTLEAFHLAVLARSDPARALELAEPLLDETHRDPLLWEETIALMRQAGRFEDAESTLLRAAALSISPELTRESKSLQRKRRLSNNPTAVVTAGLLANELRVRFGALREVRDQIPFERIIAEPSIINAMNRLSDDAKSALDAATILLASTSIQGSSLVHWATDMIIAAHRERRNAIWIGAAALDAINSPEDLLLFGRALVKCQCPATVAETLIYMVAVDASPVLSNKFAVTVMSLLDVIASKRAMAFVRARKLPKHVKSLQVTMRDISKLLLPEFDLIAFRDSLDLIGEDDEFDDDDFDPDEEFDIFEPSTGSSRAGLGRMSPEQIREALVNIGLPKKKVSNLSSTKLNALFDAMTDCANQAPDAGSFEKFARAFFAAGFTPRDMEAMDTKMSKRPLGKGTHSWPY